MVSPRMIPEGCEARNESVKYFSFSLVKYLRLLLLCQEKSGDVSSCIEKATKCGYFVYFETF
ncbi:MAG: hypothetical protein NVS4B11_15790 [Ktedonobacteraceae bacterium]